MAVGHQIARRFPAFDVERRDRPRGAGEFAFAGEKFLIDRRAENGERLAPVLNLGEFLPRHVAREEKLFRVFAETRNHVLLGRIVIVAGRNRVAIHFERREILEHILDFLNVGLAINRCVRRDLIAANFRHLDRLDTFLEHAFAFDDQIVREFQAVNVDVPIHPFRRTNDDFLFRRVVGFTDDFGFFFRNQFCFEQLLELRLNFWRIN